MRARDMTLDPLEQPSLGTWAHMPSTGANTFDLLYYSDAVPERTNGCGSPKAWVSSPLASSIHPALVPQMDGERCCRRLGPGLHGTLMHPSPKGSIRCAETAAVCAAQSTCPLYRLLCLQFRPHRRRRGRLASNEYRYSVMTSSAQRSVDTWHYKSLFLLYL